ncbi:MAG: helix-turn-helix transcriptional regulator [Lachnospiraceae bacterium]|jgi:transcriptional regulator with XRE-family HTH domain|nr:helix-turn-helix transcriptional regulator [Lachnospiraceae bacterium]
MNQMMGYLIRSNRMKQKMSQEQLCKGVCAVSYLSKIESGIAEPNDEIIRQLFERLEIEYTSNSEEIAEYKDFLFQYFDAFFHHEPTVEMEEQIYKNRKRMENSEVSIEYQLFCIYNAGVDDKGVAERLLKNVEQYRDYMSENALFLYYMAKGMYGQTVKERTQAYQKARQVRDCSLVYEALMYEAFNEGEYQEALNDCRVGYERAMQEGFLLVAKQISFLEGVCYGNQGNLEGMLKAYKRTRELSRGDKRIAASIDYNVATVYIEQNRHKDAIPYLLSALKQEQEEKSAFLINHKLAMAYEKLGEKELGHAYLAMAGRLSTQLSSIYQDMVKMARLRYEEDYMNSKEYEQLLFSFGNMEKSMGIDFVKFYKPYMVEWLKAKRKYKEALRLVEEI